MTVESGSDLIENDSTFHTDVDRSTIDRMPLESQSSSLSSIVTLSSPGVAADSNGLFHGLGDHAENSFSIDGQPITDQQSKVFSNQLPSDAIQSLEVIAGAPPAEYGDKTSLVIKATTRSGQGVTTPHGSIALRLRNLRHRQPSTSISPMVARTGATSLRSSGMNTGRFLDGPEFQTLHDKGNQQNIFDRVDFQFTDADSLHTNLQYTRSWFQTPNTFDTMNVFDQFGELGRTRPISARRSRPSTSRLPGRASSTRTPSSTSALMFAVTVTTTFPATIPWPTSAPIQQETRRSSTAR